MIDIIKPRITEGSDREMLLQIRSYLYQMSEQLQNAFVSLQGGGGGANYFSVAGNSVVYKNGSQSKEKSAQQSFNELKSLIINSADIVNSYSDKIDKILNGKYFADSDFGSFVSETQLAISANSKEILVQQTTTENIQENMKDLEEFKSSFEGYIRIGKFEDNEENAMGIEVGQSTNGEQTMRSRFTAQRLVFLDALGQELGYFKGGFLYVKGSIQVDGNLRMRRYTLDNSHGLALKFNG